MSSTLENEKLKELSALRNELKNAETELEGGKEEMANLIKSSLGGDIKDTLSSMKVEKESGRKKEKKRNKFLEKLIRICR